MLDFKDFGRNYLRMFDRFTQNVDVIDFGVDLATKKEYSEKDCKTNCCFFDKFLYDYNIVQQIYFVFGDNIFMHFCKDYFWYYGEFIKKIEDDYGVCIKSITLINESYKDIPILPTLNIDNYYTSNFKYCYFFNINERVYMFCFDNINELHSVDRWAYNRLKEMEEFNALLNDRLLEQYEYFDYLEEIRRDAII